MRDTIKGMIIGAVVAAGVSVLLAQTPTWTTPRTWATDDLLTAGQYNQQFRDNLLWLRADATLTGTAALDDLGCGTRGSGEVLYSNCDWAALPAGVVFDIHDDVTQSATIVDADRIPFSDESLNGDPMRYATAANFANYLQTEVELSANRITSDTLSVDRIPNLPASKLPAPPAVTIDALGCSGTPSADTFLRGDCEWAELPTQYVLALDQGTTTTTSPMYADAGNPATLSVTSGTVRVYVIGNNDGNSGTTCEIRVRNTTTATDVFTDALDGNFRTYTLLLATDTNPSTTSDNVYQVQYRRSSGSQSCLWRPLQNQRRGILVFSDA